MKKLAEAWRDAWYTLRVLRRAPAFTALVVATLAVGIGANTVIFSVINAVLLRPLPYPDAGRLVRLVPVPPQPGIDVPELQQLRAHTRTLSHVGVSLQVARTMAGEGEPGRVMSICYRRSLHRASRRCRSQRAQYLITYAIVPAVHTAI